jgi:putative NIF3 family GTP cyclohydrolase 1 type 2
MRFWRSRSSRGFLHGAALLSALISIAAIPPNLNAQSASSSLSASEVIERIKAHVGVPWNAETVDTFKAGDPNTKVTGIAVTMMATFDVLQRAVAKGDNLIITHEPTFYNHLDQIDQIPEKSDDPVVKQKLEFIEKNHLVIWRFHDHWHRRNPDGILAGQIRAMGWQKFQDPSNPHLFTIPETTVGQLADQLQRKLDISVMRVVGDREMKITRVALSPGAAGLQREVAALEMPEVQLLITGESREWETVEYAADAAAEGHHKALIMLSHIPSEQFGMDECTKWLKTFVNEVRVDFVPTKDPFAPKTFSPPQ